MLAPRAPDNAATEPPPGAGESLETSSTKSKVIRFANSHHLSLAYLAPCRGG